jgi:hypothetical protein
MTHSAETSEIWKGRFSYSPEEYGVIEDVYFELYVTINGEKFEGVVYDDEFRELSGDLPKVKGFIEGTHISFVVTYPFAYSINEDNVVSIDPNKKGHDVVYDGHFAPNSGKWTGKWEILPQKFKAGKDEYFQHYSCGDWEMTT